MGKMKVHELAKELKLSSKEFMEKLEEMGIEVKSHMSSLEDDEVEKIKKNLGKKSSPKKAEESKTEKASKPKVERIKAEKSKPTESESNKKERKPITPVIIRREVTRVTSSEPEKAVRNVDRDDLGVVQRRTDTSMNIKYRTEPRRPAPIATNRKPKPRPVSSDELRGITKPKVEEVETTPEVNKPVKPVEQPVQNTEDRPRPRQQFNRDDKAPFNKDGKKPFNRNQGGQQGGFVRGNKPGNRFGGTNVEKGIKDIMSAPMGDMPNKETGKENFSTEYKDKQKANRKFEEETIVKKSPKNKASRNNAEEINYEKLKDLQSETNFSSMFDDTESKMFDYYDVSKQKKNKLDKKLKQKNKEKKHHEQKIFELTDIDIPDTISVKYLAEKLKKTASDVIKKLMGYGILASLNQEIDFDTAFLVASEFGVTAHKKEVVSDEDILFDESEDKEEDLMPRPPIVVVMGHVDHGKTSLLDAIRETNVIDKEAGGITQHIGAYKVKVKDREVCFLDTPGHEAFTAMRARGAQVTDIAIIIVAANDGIMPQTVEAINHAKAAGVSIVVAINKIDVPGANIEKVKQELTEYGLVPEEWGGDVICVPISAKFRQNIDELLEVLLLVSDMKELKANPNKQAKGTVIEARLDKNTGITASLLVQRGTLNVGDTIVVGSVIGKVRAMTDDKGNKVKAAGPSTPVEIVGLTEVPTAGEVFYEVDNEKVAKHLIEKRRAKEREAMINASAPVTLDNLFNQIEAGKLRDLNIIIKADVQGSVQALRGSLEKIQNEEARVRVIHAAVGGINESDVTLAKVTNSLIIGFNVRPEPMAKSVADKEKVQINLYSVIYNAIDDIEAALKGMLKPKYKEVIQGTAEVRQVFKITNSGMVAGCYVLEGKIVRNSGVRVLRDNVVIHEGKLFSLKRMKDDAREVAEGYECGVQVEDYNDIKVGDKIESFIMEEIKQ
ncbi:MAG: translation initiation factor IF-2 [Clostridia bacterium]|nr:translation initiation factor IF-2 [Clostridia bacterium]